jgi:hypothetical protein
MSVPFADENLPFDFVCEAIVQRETERQVTNAATNRQKLQSGAELT